MSDPYEVLGVPRNATPDQVRAAYRRLAVKTHPDKTGGDDSEFKRVAEAYETLSDPQKKSRHDSGGGFEALFNNLRTKSAVPCDPFQVTIPLSAIVRGTHQRITVSMPHMCDQCTGRGTRDESLRVPCGACRGSGRMTQSLGGVFAIAIGTCGACKGRGKVVPSAAKCAGCAGEGTVPRHKNIDINIPPGTPDGHAFVIPDSGAYDAVLGRNRNVRVTVRWSVPANVRIYDRDIHTTVECTLDEVLGGFKKTVDVYGEPVEVARDAYANPTTPIVRPGKGIGGGDLVINIDVKWPEVRGGA